MPHVWPGNVAETDRAEVSYWKMSDNPHGQRLAAGSVMPIEPQRVVYILKNNSARPHYYTGRTSNLAQRLIAHNAGLCHSTADYRPWRVDVVIKFADEKRAIAFERYLKSGSGSSFATRHLR
jgi:predicted GIY-YIG superfamily endonuclease